MTNGIAHEPGCLVNIQLLHQPRAVRFGCFHDISHCHGIHDSSISASATLCSPSVSAKQQPTGKLREKGPWTRKGFALR